MNAKNHQNIRQLDLNNISVLNYLINTNNTPNGVPPRADSYTQVAP